MKRISCIILTAIMIILLSSGVYAAFDASFSLTGPSSARAGNSITVSFKADGNGICGILADITYDTSMLTYSSSSGALKDWRVEVNGGDGKLQIWAEENNSFKSPIKSQSTVIELKFRVSSNAKTGDKTTVKAAISQASDGNDEINGLSASYTLTVARPLSTDSALKSLSIDGYALKPEFSPDVTEYEIDGEVEYTKTSLKIDARPNDSESSVDISGARLSVGRNTVRVKVTAEDGSHTTVYTIVAIMKQDPDYVASSVSSLSDVKLSAGILSPPFDPDVSDYIVYVPYEVDSITVSGTPKDPKASSAKAESELTVGENELLLICIAEDGSESEYRINVQRMPQYAEQTETETEEETETETETETEPVTDTETETDTETFPDDTEPDPVTGYDTEDTDTALDEDTTVPEKKRPTQGSSKR